MISRRLWWALAGRTFVILVCGATMAVAVVADEAAQPGHVAVPKTNHWKLERG